MEDGLLIPIEYYDYGSSELLIASWFTTFIFSPYSMLLIFLDTFPMSDISSRDSVSSVIPVYFSWACTAYESLVVPPMLMLMLSIDCSVNWFRAD